MKKELLVLMFVGLISGCADMTPEQRARFHQSMQEFSRENQQNMNNTFTPLLQQQHQRPVNCTTSFNGAVASTTCY